MKRALFACLALGLTLGTLRAAEYGSISGRIVLDDKDEVPARKVLIKKGLAVKDAKVCAAETLHRDDLIIDKKSRGIANVCIWIKNKPASIHPDLADPPEGKTKIVFDQKGCRFIPHVMMVRSDQTVLVTSHDPAPHNTHTYPINPINEAENFIVPAFAGKEVFVPLKFGAGEFLPMKVGCDIHPWMNAYWLVLDHPYGAVTKEDGSFKIDKLPAGKYEVRIWHEKPGYLSGMTAPGAKALKRGYEIEVTAGHEFTFKVPLAKLK